MIVENSKAVKAACDCKSLRRLLLLLLLLLRIDLVMMYFVFGSEGKRFVVVLGVGGDSMS